MKPEGWDTPFDTPITLPKGRQLKTLRDAGNHLAGLSPRELRRPEWQRAAHDLLQAATVDRAWRIFARSSVRAAIHRKSTPAAKPATAASKAERWRELRRLRKDEASDVQTPKAGRWRAVGRGVGGNQPADRKPRND
jgi:hypothetical protein